jgi:putative membrane protein
MYYEYFKALHIIFIVTWFSGMFYIVRLFVYQTESYEKQEPERTILLQQFGIMAKRLWMGITWPSAILTLIFGPIMWYLYNGMHYPPSWLLVKLLFVVGLYTYHFSLHHIFKQHAKGIFPYTSTKLRIWNELATIFLIAIVMLATVKQSLSAVWGLVGLAAIIVLLMSAIQLYKLIRTGKK